MDTETSEVIGGVSARIDALEERIDKRFEAVHKRFEAVDKRFESVDQRFDALERSLRAEIHASLEESKRYAKVLNEDVRDDIRILAESVAAISVKLDSLRR